MHKILLFRFTMSFSWFCPECKACLTLWDSRISCLSRCFPNATAPLVTIIISLPWFCSTATWQKRMMATITLVDKVKLSFTAVCMSKDVKPAPQLRQGVPEPIHIHPVSPQRFRAWQQFVWPALTHCDGQRIFHVDEGGWLQGKTKCKNKN